MPASNSSWEGPKQKPGGGLGVQCSILQSLEGRSSLGGLTAAVADEEGTMWVASNEGLDYTITLRKPQSGEVLDTVRPTEKADASVTHMVCCGSLVWAITSAGCAFVFSSRTRTQKNSVIIAAEPITGATSRGGTVYITTASSLKMYDGASGQCTKWWSMPSPATALAVVSASVIVTGHASGHLCYWDATGHMMKEIEAHQSGTDVTCLQTVNLPSRGHTPSVISAGMDSVIRIWHDSSSPSAELRGHSAPVKGLVTPSSTLLCSCSLDGRIVLWDLQALKSVGALDQHGSPLVMLAPAQSLLNSVLWSIGQDQSLTVWGLRHGVPAALSFEDLTGELARKDRMLRAAHEELEKLESRSSAAAAEAAAVAAKQQQQLLLLEQQQVQQPPPPPPPVVAAPQPPAPQPAPDATPELEGILESLATLAARGPQREDAGPLCRDVPRRLLPRVETLQAALLDRWDAVELAEEANATTTTTAGGGGASAAAAVESLRAELEKAEEKVARLTTSTVSHLNNQLEDLMAQLDTKESGLRDAAHALAKAKAREEAQAQEAIQRRAQVDRMAAVQEQLARDVEARDADVRGLQQRLREVGGETAAQLEIESLQGAKHAAEEALSKTQQENAELVLLLDRYRTPAGRLHRSGAGNGCGGSSSSSGHSLGGGSATLGPSPAPETLEDIAARLRATDSVGEMLALLGAGAAATALPPAAPAAVSVEETVRRLEREGTLREAYERARACLGAAAAEDALLRKRDERIDALQGRLDTSDHSLLEHVGEADRLRRQLALRTEEDAAASARAAAESAELRAELQRTRAAAADAGGSAAGREAALEAALERASETEARAGDLEREAAARGREAQYLVRGVRTLKGVVRELAAAVGVDAAPLDGDEASDETLSEIVSQLRLVMAALDARTGVSSEMKHDVVALHRLVEDELQRVAPETVQQQLLPSPGRQPDTRVVASATANMRLLLQSWHRAEADAAQRLDGARTELADARQQLDEADADAKSQAQSQAASRASGGLLSAAGSSRSFQTPAQGRAAEEMALIRQALELKSKEYAALQQELHTARQRQEEKHKRITALQELTEERSRQLQEERHRSYQAQRELQHVKNELRDSHRRRGSDRERECLEERLAEAEDQLSRASSHRRGSGGGGGGGGGGDARVRELQDALEEAEEGVLAAETREGAARARCAELEGLLQEREEQIKLQQELLASRGSSPPPPPQASAAAEAAEAECGALREEVSRLQLDGRALEESLAAARRAAGEAAARQAELQGRCDGLQAELRDQQARCDELLGDRERAAAAAVAAAAATAKVPARELTPPTTRAHRQHETKQAETKQQQQQNPVTPSGFEKSLISSSAVSMSPPAPRPDLSVNMQSAKQQQLLLQQKQQAQRQKKPALPQRSGRPAPPPQYSFPPQTSEQERPLSPVEQRRVAMGLMQHNVPVTQQQVSKTGGPPIAPPPVVVSATIPSPDKERTRRRSSGGSSGQTRNSSPASTLSSSALNVSRTPSPAAVRKFSNPHASKNYDSRQSGTGSYSQKPVSRMAMR